MPLDPIKSTHLQLDDVPPELLPKHHECMLKRVCACVRVCVCVCVCTYMFAYIRTSVCMHACTCGVAKQHVLHHYCITSPSCVPSFRLKFSAQAPPSFSGTYMFAYICTSACMRACTCGVAKQHVLHHYCITSPSCVPSFRLKFSAQAPPSFSDYSLYRWKSSSSPETSPRNSTAHW